MFRNGLLPVENDRMHQFMIVRRTIGKWCFPVFQTKFGEAPEETFERVFKEVCPCCTYLTHLQSCVRLETQNLKQPFATLIGCIKAFNLHNKGHLMLYYL